MDAKCSSNAMTAKTFPDTVELLVPPLKGLQRIKFFNIIDLVQTLLIGFMIFCILIYFIKPLKV